MLKGIIHKNIDIEFDAMAGVNAKWSEAAKNFIIAPGQEKYITTVHIARNNISFQTGAQEGEEISLDIGDMSSAGLGINGLNVVTHERASKSITILDEAIKKVSNQRSKIGAYQNSLEHTMESLTVTSENLTSSESRIRDADMSKSIQVSQC